MAYNKRKATAQKKETIEPTLEDQRKKRGHEKVDEDGNYDRILDKTRKNQDESNLIEKQFDHKEDKENKTIEARMDDERTVLPGNWRDDRTHKTNTLPINELAEESQRARMKEEGQGDGFESNHYQSYKREDIKLSKENFAELKEAVDQMDKLWMASSYNRLTTSEKKDLRQLMAKRNELLGKIKK